jgi:hypothetical protein
MRHHRLKLKLEMIALISMQATLPAIDKPETPTKWQPEKNNRKITIAKHPTLNFDDSLVDKADSDSKHRTTPETRHSHKRYIHGKKTDLSTALKSDTLPNLVAGIYHDDEISEYEDNQDTSEGKCGFSWDSDSEPERRPAKRRRDSSTHAVFRASTRIPYPSVPTQASRTSDTASPPDPTALTPSPTANHSNSTSPLPPYMVPYPTPPSSLSSTIAVYGGADDSTNIRHASISTMSSTVPAPSTSDDERDIHMTDDGTYLTYSPPGPFFQPKIILPPTRLTN